MKLEVAFRRGTLRSLEDTIVMGATFGPYVHSEILLDDQACLDSIRIVSSLTRFT